MVQIGEISLAGLYREDAQYAFYISGTVTDADVGKAVALDTSAENTVKLAADDDVILGRLEVYEDRVTEGVKLATVSLEGGLRFPIDESIDGADLPAAGEYLSGEGDGNVKGSATKSRWLVTKVAADELSCEAISV